MIKNFSVFAIFAFLANSFYIPGTFAEETAGQVKSQVLSLEQIIRSGLKRSPSIKKKQADLIVAEEIRKTKRGVFFPSVDFKSAITSKDYGSGFSSALNSKPEYNNYLEAQQPLYVGGGLTSSYNYYKNLEDLATLDLKISEHNFVFDLTNAYFDVVEQKKLLMAARANEAVLKNHALIMSRYEKIGRARHTDRLQAELNWLTAQTTVQDFESLSFSRDEEFRNLLAIEELPHIEFENSLSTKLPKSSDSKSLQIESADSFLNKAFDQNLILKRAQINESNVSNEKDMDLSTDFPQLALIGQYGFKTNDRDSLLDDRFNYSSVALTLKIPLFSGLSSFAKRRQHEQKKVAVRREIEMEKLSLEKDLRSAHQNLVHVNERLKLANGIAQKAQSALEQATKEYQRGLIGSSELINIQRTKYESDKLLIQSQFSFKRALLKIYYLAGEPLMEIISRGNEFN